MSNTQKQGCCAGQLPWIPTSRPRLPWEARPTSVGRAGLGSWDLGSRPESVSPYVSDLDFKRPQKSLGRAKHCRAWEGVGGGVSGSLLTRCPQCGSHTRHPGKMSMCMLWAVLVFRKSDGQVARPLCPSQDQKFKNEGRAGCPAWETPRSTLPTDQMQLCTHSNPHTLPRSLPCADSV